MDYSEFERAVFNSGLEGSSGYYISEYHDMENNHIEKMLKKEPANYNLRIANAHLLTDFGLLEQAIVNWEIVCEMNPRESDPFWNKGIIYFRMRQYDEGLNCYNKAIENCSSKRLRELIRNQKHEWIDWYNGAGKLSDEEKNLQKHNRPATNLLYAGLRLCETNLDQSALKKIDEAIAINPNYSRSLLYKANLLSKMKRYEDAIMCYDEVIKIEPTFAQAYFFKAITFTRMQNIGRAMECYEKAMALEEPYIPAIFYIAKLFLNLERYTEARLYFSKLLDANHNFSVNSRFMKEIEKKWDGKPVEYNR